MKFPPFQNSWVHHCSEASKICTYLNLTKFKNCVIPKMFKIILIRNIEIVFTNYHKQNNKIFLGCSGADLDMVFMSCSPGLRSIKGPLSRSKNKNKHKNKN